MPVGLCGGIGEVKPVDEGVIKAIQEVRSQLVQKLREEGGKPDLKEEEFNPVPVAYKTQVVAGLNFFVKVKLGEGEFIHVRIYRDLQQNHNLHGIQQDKSEEEEIAYF